MKMGTRTSFYFVKGHNRASSGEHHAGLQALRFYSQSELVISTTTHNRVIGNTSCFLSKRPLSQEINQLDNSIHIRRGERHSATSEPEQHRKHACNGCYRPAETRAVCLGSTVLRGLNMGLARSVLTLRGQMEHQLSMCATNLPQFQHEAASSRDRRPVQTLFPGF